MSRFRSHDEMALAIADARLTTYVLAPAVCAWELHTWRLGEVLLQHVVDGAPHVTAGRVLPDCVVFLVPGGGPGSLSCNGQRVGAGSTFRWEPGSDVAVQVRRPGSWWLLSVSPEAIARATVSLAEGGEEQASVSNGPVKATPEVKSDLRQLFEEVEAASGRPGTAGIPIEASQELGEALLGAIVRLRCGDSGSARPSRRPRIDRGRIVSAVEAIFAEAESRPVYVPALSEALGLPERTLRFVFAEQYGAGPTHVLRCRRLCQVRRALLDVSADATVSEIARRFGFRHFGQFASDYRALHGELPSETLRRREARERGFARNTGRRGAETTHSAGAVAA
jgi:AraC-like DNA-binding protein